MTPQRDSKAKEFGSLTRKIRRARDGTPPAETQHLLTIEEQIKAIQEGDFEAALKQADPLIELLIYAPPEFPFITRARGIAQVREAMAHNFGAVDDQQPEITNVLAQGDLVVLIGHEHGTIRATAVRYHVQFTHRFTFVNRALTHIQIIAAYET
jgi:hypothetical protein